MRFKEPRNNASSSRRRRDKRIRSRDRRISGDGTRRVDGLLNVHKSPYDKNATSTTGADDIAYMVIGRDARYDWVKVISFPYSANGQETGFGETHQGLEVKYA